MKSQDRICFNQFVPGNGKAKKSDDPVQEHSANPGLRKSIQEAVHVFHGSILVHITEQLICYRFRGQLSIFGYMCKGAEGKPLPVFGLLSPVVCGADFLVHCQCLAQVSREIRIITAGQAAVVGQQLQGDRAEQGGRGRDQLFR